VADSSGIRGVLCGCHRVKEQLGLKMPVEIMLSTRVLKAVLRRAGCSGSCQPGFEYLQGRRLHTLSERPVLVFDQPHSKKAAFFLVFKWNLLCFSLCPLIVSCPVSGLTLRRAWLLSLVPPRQVFTQIDKILLSFFFSRLNSPHSQTLLLCQVLQALSFSRPFAALPPVCPCLS